MDKVRPRMVQCRIRKMGGMPMRLTAWFSHSASQFKSTKALARAALLLAAQVALNASLGVYLTPDNRLTFGHLALAATAALYGPVPAMANGVLADFLGWLIKPTGGYFPGFALSALLAGLIYAAGFYRRRPGILRILITRAAVVVGVNMLLNSLWIKLVYGRAFFSLPRIVKSAVQFPVDVLLLYLMFAALKRIPRALGCAEDITE